MTESATEYLVGSIAMRLRVAGVCRIDVDDTDLRRAAEGVLHELTRRPRRAAVVDWLTDAGVLQPAGVWAPPDNPAERLAEIAEAMRQRPLDFTDTELDRLQDEEGRLRDLLASGRTSPYFEDEPRPHGAAELFTAEVR